MRLLLIGTQEVQVMRFTAFCLCSILLAACASQRATPIASVGPVAPAAPAQPTSPTEIRHMYLFAPGKAPVKIVMLEDGTTTEDRDWAGPTSAP